MHSKKVLLVKNTRGEFLHWLGDNRFGYHPTPIDACNKNGYQYERDARDGCLVSDELVEYEIIYRPTGRTGKDLFINGERIDEKKIADDLARARARYNRHVDNAGIYSNQFPPFEELTPYQRLSWFQAEDDS
jgi:hypothetical protein